LYNYLFARKHGGKCILRIEDTDRTRFVENATENLIENLRWAGIEFDESLEKGGEFGPYVQSERFDLYTKYGLELLEKGLAYYAFDTSEELEAMRQRLQEEGGSFKYDRNKMRNSITLGNEETKRLLDSGEKYVIRMKVPEDGEVKFNDIIRGEVTVPCKDVDDQILLKSDGFPTYHLANVVDDHFMQISHVIRGEEWLPSTPKHVLLYQFFGWATPDFAHLPLLLNDKKAKLSKRHGDVAVEDFRAKGYLKDAFVNFIALLGWNPTGDREIYSMDELIDLFDLSKVNKAGAVFDLKKLAWMNQQYLKELSIAEAVPALKVELEKAGVANLSDEYIGKVFELFKERVTFIGEIPEMTNYLYAAPSEFEEAYMAKRWKADTADLVRPLIEKLSTLSEFTHDSTHDCTKAFCEEAGIKMGELMHPLRLMLTGKSAGAGMFDTMALIGKEECLNRFSSFLARKEAGEL
jgi:glutamyl-tRNA synthetase